MGIWVAALPKQLADVIKAGGAFSLDHERGQLAADQRPDPS